MRSPQPLLCEHFEAHVRAKRRGLSALVAAAGLVLVAAGYGIPTAAAQKASTAPFEPIGRDGHVLIVVVDGLRPDLISPEVTPTLTRLVEEGAATLDAETVQPSHTLPAITSMLTGLRPQTHGVTWNSYEPDRGLVDATTIFDVAHRAGLRTAFIAGKIKLRHAAPPGAVNELAIFNRPDSLVTIDARNCLVDEQPNLMLVHLAGVDRAGHRFGWRQDKQEEALRVADVSLGSLISIIDRGGLRGPSIVIVTADHGGLGRDHRRRVGANTTVPWILWGDGVTHTTLPPMSVTATAATALHALGLDVPTPMAAGLGQ